MIILSTYEQLIVFILFYLLFLFVVFPDNDDSHRGAILAIIFVFILLGAFYAINLFVVVLPWQFIVGTAALELLSGLLGFLSKETDR